MPTGRIPVLVDQSHESQNSSKMSDQKHSPMSPYLATLSNDQVRKTVRSATAFHAASVASKLFGGTNCTMNEVMSYVEDADARTKNKGKVHKQNSGNDDGTQFINKEWKNTNVLGKPPKPRHNQTTPDGDTYSISMQSAKPKAVNQVNTSLKQAEKSLSHGELKFRKSPSLVRNMTKSSIKSDPNNPSPESVPSKVGAKGQGKPLHPVQNNDETGTVPVKKLKSILKFPSTSSLQKLNRPTSASNFKLHQNNVNSGVFKSAGWSSRSTGEIFNARGIGGNMLAQAMSRESVVPSKKVSFFEKVEVHPVPYESRGSTEWQQNLMMQRENVLRNLFSGPPLGYMSENFFKNNNNSGNRNASCWGGPVDNWGFGIAPTRIRRPPK